MLRPTAALLRPLTNASKSLSPRRAQVMTTQVAVAAAVAGIGAIAYLKFSSAAQPDAQSEGKSPAAAGSNFTRPFGFRTLRLLSTEQLNHNTKKLRFELPDPSQPSGLTLTSALLSVSFPNGSWIPVPRPYTPTNKLDEPGFIDLTIKHYPGGKASTHLHSLKPGDTCTFAPLPQQFAWTLNKHAHVALIAGGAGITPMYQLLQGILDNPSDRTRITLVWGVNTDADIFLLDEFKALEKKYPGRFKAEYVVSQPKAGSPYRKGYVNKTVLEELGLRASETHNKDIKILVCGPPPMEKVLKGGKGPFGGSGVLAELGYNKSQIHGF
ncbi:hypothetical protein QBC38DRAFT_107766 [Podospora fimiseda]|uniref:FAD-binding FR-type domain-containing protein n=1 Tax=Podospora fimiseda TaxID=252190 RepID=A0AAN6YMG4_9PEZI|nr:hypothetical protein QBC38DRAFT_107766 [Podospora fimiseda]